jgi:hypothetical protein
MEEYDLLISHYMKADLTADQATKYIFNVEKNTVS